jgi:hypothetical protein
MLLPFRFTRPGSPSLPMEPIQEFFLRRFTARLIE